MSLGKLQIVEILTLYYLIFPLFFPPSYAIPHGVRRWEKGYYSEEQHGKVVEGFYVQPRPLPQGLRYELRCYIADSQGYRPLPGKSCYP